MPPLETRTDSPGENPEVPQDPCQHWRGILKSATESTQGLGACIDGRGIPRGPRATRMGTGQPEATRAGPWVPVVSRDHLPQLQKIQEVLPFRRDEAHFQCDVSRLITPNLWNFQRVLTPWLQIKKFPKIPVSTREEARESRPHP